VRVTASVGNVAHLVQDPRITKQGKKRFAAIANPLLKVSEKCKGLGICSASGTPIPIFLRPCATISSIDTRVLKKSIDQLKIFQEENV
jgi:hypothetical protein